MILKTHSEVPRESLLQVVEDEEATCMGNKSIKVVKTRAQQKSRPVVQDKQIFRSGK